MNSLAPTPSDHPIGQTVRYGRDLFGFIDRCKAEVGDVIRAKVARGEVYILTHPDFFELALVTERDSFENPKIFQIGQSRASETVGDECWERHSQYLQSFFGPDPVKSYDEKMVRTIDRRVSTWSDGQRISLYEQMGELALEVLFTTLFDHQLDLHGDEELRQAAYSLNMWFKPSSWVLPEWVPTPARRRFEKGQEVINEYARGLLEEREREGGTGDDLLSAYMKLRQSTDAEIADEEILNQIAVFTFAGHETTGLAMAFALHLLGQHPEVQTRFHAELDEVLDGEQPTAEDVSELEVTQNVFNETLRLYPPAHSILRITTEPVEAWGYRIPAGSDVHISAYQVHRDERFWDDPLEFKPERWNDTSPPEEGYTYVPFGAGPRSCIAQGFSRLETTLALATIGQRYELEPQSDPGFAPTMTSQPADDMPATVIAR